MRMICCQKVTNKEFYASSLSKDATLKGKYLRTSCQFFESQNVRKMSYLLCNVDEFLKKFVDLDPEANDFQNLTSSSLFKDAISDKIFIQIRSVSLYVKWLPCKQEYRQAERQKTDKVTLGIIITPWRR